MVVELSSLPIALNNHLICKVSKKNSLQDIFLLLTFVTKTTLLIAFEFSIKIMLTRYLL
jgi:hypothetical protein